MSVKSFPTKRNSQLELLRILSMVMIVAYHYSIYGFFANEVVYSPNKTLIELLSLGGEAGVSVFVLISGYYMVNSNYSFRKFSLYIGQIWFYTVGALLLFILAFPSSGLVDKEMLSISLLPISKGHYWFATSFFVLMLLSPFLNSFIKNAGRSLLLLAIWALVVIYLILPSFFGILLSYSTISRFIILYLTAGYIRLYGRESRFGLKMHISLTLLLFVYAIARITLMNYLGQRDGAENLLLHSSDIAHDGVFIYVAGLGLFMCFLRSAPRNNEVINRIAGLTFGVYLFHENHLLREMWQMVFKTSTYMNSPWLIVHAACAISLVYIAGSLLELLRQYTFGRIWLQLTDRVLVPCWNKVCGSVKSGLKYFVT